MASLASCTTEAAPRRAVNWEETRCLLCNADRTLRVDDIPEFWHEGTRCNIVCCRDCGLTYMNPRPTPDTIHCFYEDYEPHRECGLSARDSARAPRRFRRPPFWKPYHPQKHGLPLVGQGRLLDFGCGAGAFLQRMHRQGWQVTGMDFSPAVCAEIQSKLHLHALPGTLPHPDLAPESFDAVTMWHSLEHVHQPREILGHAWRLLSPGGKLVVGVPNVQSAPRRWFGQAWYGWSLPHHLTHFAPRTLTEMVRQAGFQIERLMLPGNTYWLRKSAEMASRKPHPGDCPDFRETDDGNRFAQHGNENGTVPFVARRLGMWPLLLTNRFISRQAATWLGWTGQSDEMVLMARKPHTPDTRCEFSS